ncbi:type III secretion protein [Chromobacterium vaccinii]|uniref:type III secretion protein n=1 Tax=Chromobacterium vaccinii TaxID=1108595 RepID=UPI0006182A70|nr:type III secretion protein [Chromobacterium vaccinii]
MTSPITSNGVSGGTPVLNVAGDQGGDAIGQLNDLMVQLGQLFGKLRDLLRQYNQTQQNNAFQMQKTSFNTRMDAIEKDFSAKNAQAWAQIAGGVTQFLGGVAGAKGSEAFSQIGRGADSIIQGNVGLHFSNGQAREAQEQQAVADYQHGLSEQLLKRSDETLEKALKVSSDLREILSTLNQAHERIASSVRFS